MRIENGHRDTRPDRDKISPKAAKFGLGQFALRQSLLSRPVQTVKVDEQHVSTWRSTNLEIVKSCQIHRFAILDDLVECLGFAFVVFCRSASGVRQEYATGVSNCGRLFRSLGMIILVLFVVCFWFLRWCFSLALFC